MTSVSKTEQTGSQGLAIASLILGILAILTSLVWYISIIVGVLAVIFGATSMKNGRGKAIAGIVTGSVGIVLSLLIIWLVSAALPSLQQSQRDTARKNDVSALATEVTSFMTENRGKLPGASDLSVSTLIEVSSVSDDSTPTTKSAAYRVGTNCDGVASTRAYAITVLLESGSEYCLGS